MVKLSIENVRKEETEVQPLIAILFFQPVSLLVSYFLLRFNKITPNMITFSALIVAGCGGILIIEGSIVSRITVFIFILIIIVLDYVDGTVARFRHLSSNFGKWLDSFTLSRSEDLIYLAVSLKLWQETSSIFYLILFLNLSLGIKILSILPSTSPSDDRFYISFVSEIFNKLVNNREITLFGVKRTWQPSRFYVVYLMPLMGIALIIDLHKALLGLFSLFYFIDIVGTGFLLIKRGNFSRNFALRVNEMKTSKFLLNVRTIFILFIFSYISSLCLLLWPMTTKIFLLPQKTELYLMFFSVFSIFVFIIIAVYIKSQKLYND